MSDWTPKVVVFDIGGVLVGSPFRAIVEYELSHDIPAGFINFAIAATAPNGVWQRLERGEIPLDEAFFQGFRNDLEKLEIWLNFLTRATTASTSRTAKFHQDERRLPRINAEELFSSMMMPSRTTNPYLYPAARRLRESGRFIIVALSNTIKFPHDHLLAQDLHSFRGSRDRGALFDVFVSSADVGFRKPEPTIYDFTMAKIQEFCKINSDTTIANGDVLFLDDIGSNLRPARARGWKTIKVKLGEEKDAVRELEEWTKMSLLLGTEEVSKL